MQDRAFVNAFCATHPGAEVSQPFGPEHDCWKVGGKIFALIGTEGTHVSVKTGGTEIAELLIQTGVAERAPYLHRSWVALPLDSAPDELAHRVRHSYRLVRAGLSKSVQANLPPLSKVERPAE